MIKERNNKRYKTKYAGVHYRIKKNGDKSYVVQLHTGKEITIKPSTEFPKITDIIALRIKNRLDEDIRLGINQQQQKGSNMTFEQFFDDYADLNKLSPKIIDTNYRICKNHIFPQIGKIKLNDISQFEVNKVANYISRLRIKEVSKKHYINIFIAIINCAKKCKLIQSQTIETKLINRPKLRSEEEVRARYMTKEEMQIFLSDDDIKNNDYIYLFFLILCHTGARGISASKIKAKDIDKNDNTIQLEDTKNGGFYTIPLHKKVIDIILNYVKNNNLKEDEYIFNDKKLQEEKYTNWKHWHSIHSRIFKAIKKVGAKHGIDTKGLGLHAIRKGFTVILFESGLPLKIISKYLNHGDERTTSKHYLMVTKETLLKNRVDINLF